MRRTTKLPILLEIRPSELLAAFMSRTADANVLSPKQLSDVLREVAYGTDSRPTGANDAQALSKMLSALGDPAFVEQPATVSDLTVRNWSGRTFKQICPACLKADQAITHGLAEKTWAVCSVHRIAHVTHCPECHARLAWGRGSYFYCACGFDLRSAAMVPASTKLYAFLAAVIHDRSLDALGRSDLQEAQAREIHDIWAMKVRLKTTFAYLTGGLAASSDVLPRESAQSTTPFLHFWEEVMRAVTAAGGLAEAVRAIEVRLALAGRARASAATREGHLRRSQVTWKYLSECASAAVEAAPRVDKNTIFFSTKAGHRVSADVAALKKLPPELSNAFRSALDREIRSFLESQDTCSEEVKGRLEAITGSARDLRELRPPEWVHPAFGDVAEILSLIACGVLSPWGPSHLLNWHVRATELDKVASDFQLLPDSHEGIRPTVGYVLRHSTIFNARSSVHEWLSLSRHEVAERIRRLLPAWEDSYRSRGECSAVPREALLPFGFSYFLKDRWVGLFAIDGETKIGKSYIVTSDEDVLHDALMGAWESAGAWAARLRDWALDSALASQQVLQSCPPTGNPLFGTGAANATLAFKVQVGMDVFSSALSNFLCTGVGCNETNTVNRPGI